MKHVLANRAGIDLFAALLTASGAACSECGYGTRATSKRWAKCKRCGHRVRRRTMDEAEAFLRTPEAPDA